MNLIGIIIILTLLVELLLNGIADYLNLKVVRKELPDHFKGIYDKDRYTQSLQYMRVTTRFGQITSGLSMIAILIFWFGKGFPLLDQWVRSSGNGPVISGLIYCGILFLLISLLSLPFNVYSTFVIEQRFGFNRTTKSTFFFDLIKGLVLTVLIAGPLLSGIFGLFNYAGANAWWWCWIAVTIYSLVINYVAPTWIMPIFNKFKPLEHGELRQAIISYTKSIKFPLKNIFVMDGSRRSEKSNAFFTGFGKNKRIVLFDTLIENHTIEEIVAILAHEMGHYKKKHIMLTLIMGIAQTGLMFFLISIFISFQGLFDAFYIQEKSVYAGMIFFGMLYAPIDLFTGVFMNMLSRRNEYQADQFALETTKNPQAIIDALKKLSIKNMSNLVPHPFYVFLNNSHPPVLQRLNAIEKG
jgi:STE24 endopeptidase